ncbi:MAG: PAS domain S-box protein, partial [Rubrobacter sp.]|nr:PAS domain S-box protein [Rubrobacter sp.]
MTAEAETYAYQTSVLLVALDEQDYIMVRDLLCEAKGSRFVLEWAASYEAALKMIKCNRYYAYVVNYHLGERSGLELLQEMVGRGYRAPVIMLTAEGEHEAGLEAMDAGAVDYLTREHIEAPLLERSVRRAVQRRQAEERFHLLMQNASDIITVLKADGTILYESPAVEWVLGYHPEELVGKSVFDYIHPDDVARVLRAYTTSSGRPGANLLLEFRFRHADGSWRHLEVSGKNRLAETSVKGIVVNLRDVSERRFLEERLIYQAVHDTLTSLPNRTLFMSRLEQALAREGRPKNAVAVLFLGLDNFKAVNDSLGYEVGDKLLEGTAERIR